MSSLETTEMKLRTTPTGGVAGEHSPYYRRLLSAGYKGFLQGTIGGAGLYGVFGLAIGALVGLPAALFIGTEALLLIPAAASVGMMKGAHTFGNIGTVAAISAESADLAEQRRYLLDRYYDLPEGKEGDKQAEIIKNELNRLNNSSERKHPLFHWKTVAICAAIGGLIALGLCSPLGMSLLAETPVMHVLEPLLHTLGVAAGSSATGLTALGTTLGISLGALTGSVIGIDRHYVRSWFDSSERLLHDNSHTLHALNERSQQVERLKTAAKADEQTRLIMERQGHLYPYPDKAAEQQAQELPITNKSSTASLDTPTNTVSHSNLQERMVDIQKAMDIPIS